MATPLVWMVLSSFKSMGEIESVELTFFPEEWVLSNYAEMAEVFSVAQYYRNSILLAVISVIVVLFTSSWMGFVFAKFDFVGSRVLFVFILATMMIPQTVTLIPVYLIVYWLGMLDTIWGLFVPGAVSAFGIFLMRQFIATVPDDLLDAAKIDGCSDFRVYAQIVLPLIQPALAALAIFVFIGSWDSFLWPLVVLTRDTWRTLPLGLALFAEENYLRTNLSMAGATVSVVPVLIFYLIFQKQFVQGITMTGMAGV